MYGKALTHKKHNPHRNADNLGMVSFWRPVARDQPDPEAKEEDKYEKLKMQPPRCVNSFYVPNPINYTYGTWGKKMYLLEGVGN